MFTEEEDPKKSLERDLSKQMHQIQTNQLESSVKVVFKNRLDKALHLSYVTIKSMVDFPTDFSFDDMFVVWHCKTLQNWKAITSASFSGAPLIEVTYNGDKKETYIDVYRKLDNVRIPD